MQLMEQVFTGIQAYFILISSRFGNASYSDWGSAQLVCSIELCAEERKCLPWVEKWSIQHVH